MEHKTEREVLVERFNNEKANNGLVDMKFFVGEVNESTTEQVCGDVNRVLVKAENDEYSVLDKWNDSRQ